MQQHADGADFPARHNRIWPIAVEPGPGLLVGQTGGTRDPQAREHLSRGQRVMIIAGSTNFCRLASRHTGFRSASGVLAKGAYPLAGARPTKFFRNVRFSGRSLVAYFPDSTTRWRLPKMRERCCKREWHYRVPRTCAG